MPCAARTRSSKCGSSPAVPGTNAVSNRCPENPSSRSAASSAPYCGKCDASEGGGDSAQERTSKALATSTDARAAKQALNDDLPCWSDACFDLIVEEPRPTVRLSDSTDK